MLKYAFKEWAVICQALADGRQALILRKGGIAEDAGEFQLEHNSFWLYPTYVHQQSQGVKDSALPLLERAQADPPPAGVIRLAHFAEVAGIYELHDIVGAMRLRDLHVWSDETIASRFHYRRPGLFVLAVRIYQAASPIEVAELPHYAGCRSWVELERELPTDGAQPVLYDDEFQRFLHDLEQRLHPVALA